MSSMSTLGAVEEALRELDRASERVGYALERANREGATEDDRAAAEGASRERNERRTVLLEAIHEHAATQYQSGIELGRSRGG